MRTKNERFLARIIASILAVTFVLSSFMPAPIIAGEFYGGPEAASGIDSPEAEAEIPPDDDSSVSNPPSGDGDGQTDNDNLNEENPPPPDGDDDEDPYIPDESYPGLGDDEDPYLPDDDDDTYADDPYDGDDEDDDTITGPPITGPPVFPVTPGTPLPPSTGGALGSALPVINEYGLDEHATIEGDIDEALYTHFTALGVQGNLEVRVNLPDGFSWAVNPIDPLGNIIPVHHLDGEGTVDFRIDILGSSDVPINDVVTISIFDNADYVTRYATREILFLVGQDGFEGIVPANDFPVEIEVMSVQGFNNPNFLPGTGLFSFSGTGWVHRGSIGWPHVIMGQPTNPVSITLNNAHIPAGSVPVWTFTPWHAAQVSPPPPIGTNNVLRGANSVNFTTAHLANMNAWSFHIHFEIPITFPTTLPGRGENPSPIVHNSYEIRAIIGGTVVNGQVVGGTIPPTSGELLAQLGDTIHFEARPTPGSIGDNTRSRFTSQVSMPPGFNRHPAGIGQSSNDWRVFAYTTATAHVHAGFEPFLVEHEFTFTEHAQSAPNGTFSTYRTSPRQPISGWAPHGLHVSFEGTPPSPQQYHGFDPALWEFDWYFGTGSIVSNDPWHQLHVLNVDRPVDVRAGFYQTHFPLTFSASEGGDVRAFVRELSGALTPITSGTWVRRHGSGI